jgi:hypothetical protein
VQTASKLPVRRPIHNRSVGRWAPFAAHLEPLRLAIGIARGASRPGESDSPPLEDRHVG